MEIIRANINDLNEVSKIFINASIHMKEEKNLKQWEVIDNDFINSIIAYIKKKEAYIVKNGDEIVGFFALIYDEDKTYKVIKNGKWLNDEKYVTIHKIAVKYFQKHIATFILKYIENKIKSENIYNIRIDTHNDNISMLSFLKKNNFSYCGIISITCDFNDFISLRKAFIKVI